MPSLFQILRSLITGVRIASAGIQAAQAVRVGSALSKRIPLLLAIRLAWPLGRTVGTISNAIQPGRKTLFEAFNEGDWFAIGERLATSHPLSPYGPLGLGLDFWRGAAYPTATEAAEAWVTEFAELGIPGSDTNNIVAGIFTGDVGRVIDGVTDSIKEGIGLEGVRGYFGGIAEIVSSISGQRITPETAGGAISGFLLWIEKLLDIAGEITGTKAEELAEEGEDIITGGIEEELGRETRETDAFERTQRSSIRSLRRMIRDPLIDRIIDELKKRA